MSGSIIRYVNPWKYRREQDALRLAALRGRDGDECRRCRRPMRFDLPEGHDLGPKVESVLSQPAQSEESIDNLCLTHRRCIGDAGDNTREVQERVRRKNEAELFARSRQKRRRA